MHVGAYKSTQPPTHHHHHAPTHAPTHARPSLPVNPNPSLTPAVQYGMALHDTAAMYVCMYVCIMCRYSTNNDLVYDRMK